MTKKDLTVEMSIAFLKTQLQKALSQQQGAISALAAQGKFTEVAKTAESAQTLQKLQKNLDEIAKHLTKLETPVSSEKLSKGLKTPQDAYRVLILQILIKLGGEAHTHTVLDRIYDMMGDQLNTYDMEILSDGKSPRWRNTAQWARNAMREEGLIADDSPRGIWAITAVGRTWLKEQEQE